MSLTATSRQRVKHLGFNLLRPRCFLSSALFLFVLAGTAFGATPREFRPQSDDDVIEVFAPKTKSQPKTIDEAVAQAKLALQSSRDLQDPRYLGRARALLQPWWGKDNATQELLVLQATIEQSLHLFADSRKTLLRVVSLYPQNVQSRLTLASLDRLTGSYKSALALCHQVSGVASTSTEKFYGDLCAADLQCHLTNTSLPFRDLVSKLNRARLNGQLLSWAFSLLAECEERAGDSLKALAAYRSSIALVPDSYTIISYADALLRGKQPELAMQVLATQPKSDSVLLRLAHAMRMRDMAQWKMIHNDIMQRFAESALRGDEVAQHARERAYAALWLSDDFREATAQASVNVETQKEVIDWLLLFEAIERTKDKTLLRRYAALLQNTGLQDARLATWAAKK
jgi:tetratricopeptide (TPR) repeat protein